MSYNLNTVRDALSRVGIGIKRTIAGDYRVFIHALNGKKREDAAYYSDDLEDCLLTGFTLARDHKARTA